MFEECFNEEDLDEGVITMDELKESVLGAYKFIYFDKSGILKTNEMVFAKDIESMFTKYAYEDSLKLIILKSLQ
jgi:hypothetical protein